MQDELMTIELKGLRFLAFHGLYAEEKKTGNEFEIDIRVSHIPKTEVILSLQDTVNYVQLYSLIRSEMQYPRELLETFVMELSEKIHDRFPRIKKINISLMKANPPMLGAIGKVGVHFEKEY